MVEVLTAAGSTVAKEIHCLTKLIHLRRCRCRECSAERSRVNLHEIIQLIVHVVDGSLTLIRRTDGLAFDELIHVRGTQGRDRIRRSRQIIDGVRQLVFAEILIRLFRQRRTHISRTRHLGIFSLGRVDHRIDTCVVVQTDDQGTGQQTTCLHIAVPVVTRRNRGIAEAIAEVQDVILFLRTDLREQQGIHPSHQRLTGREGTLLRVLIFQFRDERHLVETYIRPSEERKRSLGLLDAPVAILHTVLKELCDIRRLCSIQRDFDSL